MTTLRCVCGAVVEGTEGELLEAVERHLREHDVREREAAAEAHTAGVTEVREEGGKDA